MLGLLYKDFFTAKKELLLTFVMLALFVGYNAVIGQKEMLGPTLGIMVSLGTMTPTYSLHYDKTCGWNKFVCASPISRTKVILAKYFAGILSASAFGLVIIVSNLTAGSPMPSWAYPLLFCVILFAQAIMMPVSLRLGQNMVVVVFLLMVFVPTDLLFGLNKAGIWSDEAISSAFDLVQNNIASLIPVLILVVLALYVLSFLVTRRIYQRMEF